MSETWCRAVWMEGKREEEGVVPANWIQGKIIRWPKVTNAARYMKESIEPAETWWMFPLMKIKCLSSKLCVCTL